MLKNQVKIISDGTPQRTHVYDHEGNEIKHVQNVTVSIGTGRLATADMTIAAPGFEMFGVLGQVTVMGSTDTETLAKSLHEAGRAAVEAGNTVAAEKFGEQTSKFMEWDDITEPAREGRRIQARWLLERFFISAKASE